MENIFNLNFAFFQYFAKVNFFSSFLEKPASANFIKSNKERTSILKSIVDQEIQKEIFRSKFNDDVEGTVQKKLTELMDANTKLEIESEIVLKASRVLEEKNKEMLDSLNYAKLIQNAIMHKKETVKKILPESFVLNMPLNVVSGDFVRVEKKQNKVLVALADCTGHGIPGAMVSMIGTALINEIINYKNVLRPSAILTLLDSSFRELTNDDHEVNDGMDIGMFSIDEKTLELNYSGAHRPLYIVRGANLIEIKSDNLSIGGDGTEEKIFTNHCFQLDKGDRIYMLSDGYTDQFGGPLGKKYSTKQFKNLLLSIQHMNMEEQGVYLKQTINDWKKGYFQIDDICVLGISI